MRGTIEMVVFADPMVDPDALQHVWQAYTKDKLGEPLARQQFPLVAMPPPDTLLMRALDEDFSVFGEDIGTDTMQMIDGESIATYAHDERLAAMIDNAPATAATLADFAKRHGVEVSRDVLVDALTKGTWPTTADAMHQAAAFAFHLMPMMRLCRGTERAVVWAFRGTPVSYAYP